jgi:membrane protease subunit (stomatin/prohibitin family)
MKALISQAYIGVKTEEVRTSVAQAEQKRKLVEEQTEAQLRILRAQSEAEVMRAQGLAEAEIMRAKGYTEKDKIEADVQKAYAEGMGQFGSNIGSGGSGGAGADIVSMMAGLKVAETMLGKMDHALAGATTSATTAPVAETWSCSCGETGNTKNFCMNCGNPKPTANRCAVCGAEMTPSAKFCPECGAAAKRVCPKCGGEVAANAKFCPECGEKL